MHKNYSTVRPIIGSLEFEETNWDTSAWPWAQSLAASFVVPGDPEAAHVSPAYEYGFQVDDLKTLAVAVVKSLLKSLCRYKVDMAKY